MIKYIFYLFILILVSCKKASNYNINNQNFKYIKSIKITSNNNQIVINNLNNFKTILNQNNLPLKNCILGSSSYIGYFKALNIESKIIGVISSNNFYSDFIHDQIKLKNIIDLGNSEFLEIEKIIHLKPDIFITYSNPNHLKQIEILKKNGIQVLLIDDYLENSPLGKSELIKIFGILFNKEEKSNEIFNSIEKNYIFWKNKVQNINKKPTVFGKIMYGDFWFMPQRESFSAKYYTDSGGNYIWNNIQGNGSEQLNFEEVLAKAQHADFWFDASDFQNKNELLQQNINYKLFDCFKNNQIYSLSKRRKTNGTNDYYETGNLYSDSVLIDYISILHPELLQNYNTKFIKKLD